MSVKKELRVKKKKKSNNMHVQQQHDDEHINISYATDTYTNT